MNTVRLLSVLLIAVGCSPAPPQDRVRFDALLETGRIDHIAFIGGPFHLTNEAWDTRICEGLCLREFNATNRVDAVAHNLTNAPTGLVLFYSGTNVLGSFSYHRAQEVLVFGTYCFRLKGETNVYRWFYP